MADSSGNAGSKWSSVSLITAVVLLILVAGLGLYFQKRASNAAELRIHTLEVLTEIESVRVEVAEISRSVRGYAISGKESWLEP